MSGARASAASRPSRYQRLSCCRHAISARCIRADLAESQSRLDAQPHKVGGGQPDRLWDNNRVGLVRRTRRAEGQLHARVRERVSDQFLRGQEP
jgi:hypothetical protein